MIELIQFAWSPFCLVQRRMLEYSGNPFRIRGVSCVDRSLVWRLTRQRYYQVPIIRDGSMVVFETDADSQVIAKYLDNKLQLELFPHVWEGLQNLIWRDIENEIEGLTFKLNDIYSPEFVPAKDWLGFLRHKERKFGRGCLEQWRHQQSQLLAELTHRLSPYDQMLAVRPWLLDDQPRFVDFDLYGMLANFLYSGHYQLPAEHRNLCAWYERLSKLKRPAVQ